MGTTLCNGRQNLYFCLRIHKPPTLSYIKHKKEKPYIIFYIKDYIYSDKIPIFFLQLYMPLSYFPVIQHYLYSTLFSILCNQHKKFLIYALYEITEMKTVYFWKSDSSYMHYLPADGQCLLCFTYICFIYIGSVYMIYNR